MPKKISYEEMLERFKNHTDVELIKDDYNGFRKKSKFYNKVTGEYFWESARNILKSKSLLHNNKKLQIIPLEEAKRRFAEQGRIDIKLIDETYTRWTEKAKFWDDIEKDYFFGIPKIVYGRLASHPNRRIQKIRDTTFKRYGVYSFTKTQEYKNKTKETCLKKYNTEFSSQSEVVKKKRRKTNLERYGTEQYFSSEDYKKKSKETCLKKYNTEYFVSTKESQDIIRQRAMEQYGIDNFSKAAEIKEKKIKTCLERHNVKFMFHDRELMKNSMLKKYNVEHYSHTDEYKEKYKATCMKVFGAENYFGSDKYRENAELYWVCDKNMYLVDWYKTFPEPKPRYYYICSQLNNKETNSEELSKIIENYKSNKTSLEVFTENLFNIKHFNRKPDEITKLYKPDFKLSDRHYLNVDGLYWHSVDKKGKWYHYNLRKEFEKAGLRIFQFYDYEMYNNMNIVKSIIDRIINNNNFQKIDINNCLCKPVIQEEAEQFLIKNDIKGATIANHIGLYYDKELVSLLSYNIINNNKCKIERFCSATDVIIDGDFCLLFSNLKKDYIGIKIIQIYSWVDLRYENEEFLLKNGFVKNKDKLGWKWTDFKTTFEDSDTKECYIRSKWCKIYDAGQRLFVYYVNVGIL